MRAMRRILIVLASLCFLQCHPSTQKSRTLHIAIRATISSLDPIMENSLNAICIDDNIFEPLVVRDADLKINPELALDWSAPDDHSWILELRKGVLFHDGSPLTAEDVKFSLERARSEPASKIQDALAMVDRVEVVSTSRIKIITKQ